MSRLRLSDSDFERKFQISKIRFSKLISKSVFSIPLESPFETPKFEFSDVENPQILIVASKFKFFFYQNLDFLLSEMRRGNIGT